MDRSPFLDVGRGIALRGTLPVRVFAGIRLHRAERL
jgi:hypothetical protein